MTEVSTSPAEDIEPGEDFEEGRRSVGSFLRDTEIDTRLLGMLVALVIIWIGFHYLSGGTFLSARNLWNLSVQTASVAIMATGMVLVIVTRNIDLSVGSMMGFIGIRRMSPAW